MKNILKIVSFGLILVILLNIMAAVFNEGLLARKRCVIYYDRRIAELSKEPEGEINVLFVGDSLCSAAFCTPLLYRDYGITAFNMGKEMERSIETYYCIKKAIRKQPIKVVVWEAHNLTKRYKDTEPWDYGLTESLRYYFPYVGFHNFWKYIVDQRSLRKYYKGTLVSETVKPYEGVIPYYDPNTVDESLELHFEQEYMLDKIQKLCDENGIKLVLYSAVSPKCYTSSWHECFAKAAQERGLDYIDANMDLETLGIDWENDFYDDGDHVNVFGSEKLTAHLGEYFVRECDLPDHRGEPGFESWDDMLRAYDQEVIDMEGTDYFIKEKEAGIKRQVLVQTPMTR